MSNNSHYWQLQEAKNKLSRVLKDADSGGPQYITVHGRNTAVILSTRDYERLKRHSTSLETALAVPILDDEEVADLFERSSDTGRTLDF